MYIYRFIKYGMQNPGLLDSRLPACLHGVLPCWWQRISNRMNSTLPERNPLQQPIKNDTLNNLPYSTENSDEIVSVPFTCPKLFGMWPLFESCTEYVKCNEGEPTLYTCPTGLHYNPAAKKCDFPHHTLYPYQCPTPDGEFPLIGDCDTYIECTANRPVFKVCDVGFHWSKFTVHCEPEEVADCPFQCPEAYMKMKMPDNCSQFIECVDFVIVVKYCPTPLYWNDRLKMCDDPKNVNCEFTCPEVFGFFPIIGQCENYMVCINGDSILKQCPEGLHYNHKNKVCDLPADAECTVTGS